MWIQLPSLSDLFYNNFGNAKKSRPIFVTSSVCGRGGGGVGGGQDFQGSKSQILCSLFF